VGEATPTAGRPLTAGTVLASGYVVIEHVRRGVDLDVYELHSEERDCGCVGKVVHEHAADPLAAERLLAEGRLLLELTHPHLVRAYELRQEPRPLLVLETLGGATLSWLIAERSRRLPAADLCHLALHLCSALGYLHRRGWLHLDLKASNVISSEGRAKLIDLSLARRPGAVPAGWGTREYMAPEQAMGGEATVATDVWGVGAVLFAAATGRRPFRALPVGHEQLSGRAAPVGSLRRLPQPVSGLVDRCLEPDPSARPQLDELTAGLHAVLGSQ